MISPLAAEISMIVLSARAASWRLDWDEIWEILGERGPCENSAIKKKKKDYL